jgi:hypothetical protein
MLGDDVGQRRKLQSEPVVFALSSADDLCSAAAAIVGIPSQSAVRVAHSRQARLHLRRSMGVVAWRSGFGGIDGFEASRPGLLPGHRCRRVVDRCNNSERRGDAGHDGDMLHDFLPLGRALRDLPVVLANAAVASRTIAVYPRQG